jgi:hypothetical protein
MTEAEEQTLKAKLFDIMTMIDYWTQQRDLLTTELIKMQTEKLPPTQLVEENK